MTADPTKSMGFRPTLSMTALDGERKEKLAHFAPVKGGGDLTMAGTVLTRNTTPVTPVASNATVPLFNPRLINTSEA